MNTLKLKKYFFNLNNFIKDYLLLKLKKKK